jgi:uncharacterized protein
VRPGATCSEVAVKIVGLWRYPVKSLQGEALDEVWLEDDGVAGDRRWGIRDERTGRILTARRLPALLTASACYQDDRPVITLPGGHVVVGPGSMADNALSDWLGRPVTLVAASSEREPGRAEYFTDAVDDTSEAIEWTMPLGRYVDASPILLLTTASLRIGASLHPAGDWSSRRFRPNVLVDLDGEGWVEDGWIGQQVRTGSTTVMPVQPCVRCTMVTRPQPGLEADPDVFRTLARHHRGLFGVWCEVTVAGSISVGDAVVAPAGRDGRLVDPCSI